jgi:hypothetical protein
MSNTYIQATLVIQATALDQHAVCAAQHATLPTLHPASFAVIQHATAVALSEQMRQTYKVHTISSTHPNSGLVWYLWISLCGAVFEQPF